MKNMLFVFVMLAAGVAKGQDFTSTAEKHSNFIVVKTSLSVNDAMRAIGRALVKEGYQIENTDPLLQTITTKRLVDGGFIKYNCQIFSEFDGEQNACVVKLYARQAGLDSFTANNWQPLYPGFKKTWEKLEAIAASLGGEVLYGKDEKG